MFYKGYLGEEILKFFASYTDMKHIYPIQVIDLRFQVDHINPRKIQLIPEYKGATNNARSLMILLGHREIKMISDGIIITEVNII